MKKIQLISWQNCQDSAIISSSYQENRVYCIAQSCAKPVSNLWRRALKVLAEASISRRTIGVKAKMPDSSFVILINFRSSEVWFSKRALKSSSENENDRLIWWQISTWTNPYSNCWISRTGKFLGIRNCN